MHRYERIGRVNSPDDLANDLAAVADAASRGDASELATLAGHRDDRISDAASEALRDLACLEGADWQPRPAAAQTANTYANRAPADDGGVNRKAS